MRPVEEREKAAAWAQKGLTFGAIAARLGVSTTTVRRWLVPEYAAYCKEATKAYRQANPDKRKRWDTVPCPSCRKSRVERGVRHCRRCEREARDGRWSEIRQLWNEANLTVKGIALKTGRTEQAVQQDVTRMRKAGHKLKPRTRAETRALNAALSKRGEDDHEAV